MEGSRDKDAAKPSQMVNGWEIRGKKLITKDALYSYLKSVKDQFKDNKEKYDQFIDVMKDFKAQRIDPIEVIARVKDLFGAHTDLIVGFNSLLPKGYEINYQPPAPDTKSVQQSEFEAAITFMKKIKTGFAPSDGYQEFLNFLQMYRRGKITRSELKKSVSDLFSAYPPDLIEGFNEFLSSCEKINGFLVEMNFSKSTRAEEEEEEEVSNHRDHGKYAGKPILELDLSKCESCTPSYRLLPKDYPIPLTSHRTKLGDEVLNDHWVSVSNTETDHGYSFKPRRKTQYEERLFRCEDDRFEMDLLLEIVNETIKRVEELLKKINDNNGFILRVEEHFTVQNRMCIERIYGEHGLDVMDVLKNNAAFALPILLARLKQKHEEWSTCRVVFNQVWAAIYTNNRCRATKNKACKK